MSFNDGSHSDKTSGQAGDMLSNKRRSIAVIDGNSLMHRAFHAIPPTMSSADGTPTGAVFGFLSMLLKMYELFHPDGIICAFDKGKPQIRMDMLPQYKAQRPPMDPNLREQFPVIKDVLKSMEIPVVELEGWEGDDILGTLARRGEKAGYQMYLITGDRDMYQLSTENVFIVGTKKGLSDVAIMTPESVESLYHGITPALVPDFYGLKGDSSDNIPGVPGIGPKRASDLIVQYGSLDEVIAHADEVKGKVGESLRAHIDDALLSRTVATIRCDAPLDIDLADARFPSFDVNKVRDTLLSLGFSSMIQKVLRLKDKDGSFGSKAHASDTPDAVFLSKALSVKEKDAAHKLLDEAICAHEWCGVSLEEDKESNALFGFGHRLWVSSSQGIACFSNDELSDVLVKLVQKAYFAAGDIKSLLHIIYPVDSSRPALIKKEDIDPARIFDIQVAAYILNSSLSDLSVSHIAEKYLFDYSVQTMDETLPLAARLAYMSGRLVEKLSSALKEDNSLKLFSEIEMPLLPVLLDMERLGLHADPNIFAAQSRELAGEINAKSISIFNEAQEKFNLDSPMQLSHVLFDVLGLPTAGLKKTQRGYYSTNAKVLGDLADKYHIVADVLDYRERAKIKSTYLDALPQLILGDGRIHTTFNQSVTATGRLSSSDPNLQNIPTRSELGHRVRQAFTVPADSVFLACDYSQIELRLLAHLSGDEHLIKAFCEGEDFHAETAARIFKVALTDVTHEMRSRAKAVNFGIVYGQQAFGLSSSLKISRSEAQEMIDRYYEAYPRVREFLDEQVALAHKQGWVETMYGRKRHIKEIYARNRQLVAFGERTAMNHPMQGSAADIIKIAMVRVAQRLDEEKLKTKLVLQIHDELDFEVPTEEQARVSDLVKQTMESVVSLKVPLVAEVSCGKNWALAK